MHETEHFDLTINGRVFEASLSDHDDTRLMFSVGKGAANWRGCVSITWYKSPRFSKHAVLEWFGYDATCPKDADMKRGRSKTMLIGALAAFKDLVQKRYRHVSTVWLQDASTFRCPGSVEETSTMLASMFRHGKTYYQRLLNVAPLPTSDAPAILEAALERLDADVDGATIAEFRRLLKTKELDSALEDARGTWRRFMSTVDCAFVERHELALLRFFGLRDLQGAVWEVAVTDIPVSTGGRVVAWSMVPMAQDGGRDARADAAREASEAFRDSCMWSRASPEQRAHAERIKQRRRIISPALKNAPLPT